MEVDDTLRTELEDLYDEVMWLARRPRVTPSFARAWYTHVRADFLKRRIRRFSGFVSVAAALGTEDLRLEHFERIQTTLTGLITRHLAEEIRDPSDFIRTLVNCERVHVVTVRENYAALACKGDYEQAGIELVSWNEVPIDRRAELWKKMLRGKVANAADFSVV